MLTDPLAPANAMARCRGGYVPGELQLGLCKPINPSKKKSGFSLNPMFTEISEPDVLACTLASLHRERDVQRNPQLGICVINSPKMVSPKMGYPTILQHPWDHFF